MDQGNNRITLYLDADDTILLSSEAVIKILNQKYNINPPKTINNMKDWEYRSIYKYITIKEVEDIYESDEFFNMVEFNPLFLDFYNKNKNKINIVIVTKGTELNVTKKEKYIKSILGEDIEYIGMTFKYDADGKRIKDYSKTNINMKNLW